MQVHPVFTLHVLMLPGVHHCLQTSTSSSWQLGAGTQLGYCSSLHCSPQNSIEAVNVSRTLARFGGTHNFTCGKQVRGCLTLNAYISFMQVLNLVYRRMGTDRSMNKGPNPDPACEGKSPTLLSVGCGTLSFPGRPGTPVKRFLLLSLGETNPQTEPVYQWNEYFTIT